MVDHLKELTSAPTYDGQGELSGSLRDLHRKSHQTIRKVTEDIENRFHFNTAIAAVMELINEVNKFLSGGHEKDTKAWSVVKEAVEAAIVLLSPVVPHITEELWRMLGRDDFLLNVSWPGYNEEALEVDKRLIVIQVNGKVRSRIEVPASHGQKEIEAEALADEKIRGYVGEKPIKKVIVVKHKLVNVVV